MKKKFLSLILSICLMIPCAFALAACKDNPPDNPPATITYTVSETQWDINFNLTKGQAQGQTLSFPGDRYVRNQLLDNTLAPITSYTVYAEGQNAGTNGSSLLKVAPNAMAIEFKVEGVIKEGETGTFTNDNVLYKSVTKNMSMFLPFKNYYDSFTFDETKNAYVCENLESEVVDDYDITKKDTLYTKSAEVTFNNGYLKTVKVELCDSTYTEVFASFTFTFSDINATTVTA